jgi:hypothetical protein
VVHICLDARDLFLVQGIQTSSGINKTFIFQEQQGCFAHGIKQLGYTADHSPPSTAKANNEWSYTSTPHTYDTHRHDITFTVTQDLKHCNLSVKNNSPQCSSSLQVTGHT